MRRKIVLGLLIVSSSTSFAQNAADAQLVDALGSLQRQVRRHLKEPSVARRVTEWTRDQDLRCSQQTERRPLELRLPLPGGEELGNYREILPGISRFEFPTLEALEAAHASGLCDEVYSMNLECMLSKFDVDQNATLKGPEEAAARVALRALGQGPEFEEKMILFYQRNARVCLSPQKNSWHEVLPAREPEEGVRQIFKLLDRVLYARAAGKRVCFHCAVGKHRTGLSSMLLELAQADEIGPETLGPAVDRYFQHAWFDQCDSRAQTVEMLPLVLESKPYQEFRDRWRALGLPSL